MAQPTTFSVVTDNVEYSRYEVGKDTVQVTVAISGGAPYVAEEVLVELVKARRSRDAVVSTATITFTGTADIQTSSASFHLPDMVDQDMINLVRHGRYYIRVRSLATVSSVVVGTTSSAPFNIQTLDTGVDQNTWSVEVVVPTGTAPLDVVVVGSKITYSLAVSGGVPVDSQNTRELLAAKLNALYGNLFYASVSGTADLPLTLEDPEQLFSGGRDDVFGASSDFDVRIITVDRLKTDYLFGVPLYAGEARYVKYQPSSITGVTVTETSKTHPFGLFPLTYTYFTDGLTNATSVIGAYLGVDGTITITATGVYEGLAGNSWSVEVLVPGGTSALLVTAAGNTLSISLDTTLGVPNDPANTASLVAAAISAVPGFSAVASGTGGLSMSVAHAGVPFTGGTDQLIRQMSWNGGAPVSITRPGTYILRSGTAGIICAPALLRAAQAAQDYIVIRVAGPTFLPVVSATEELMIQNRQIDDATLGKYLSAAEDWLEHVALSVYLEPTNVVTDRDPTTIQFSAGVNSPNPIFTDPDYDFIVGPLTHFVRNSASWLGVQTPFMSILRVDSLFGSIANTRVIDLDLDWIQFYPQGGFIQLVPFNQTVAFDFLGLIWANALSGAVDIPNFWHFNIIAGLRDCPSDLQEVIAKKAAMDALIMLGNAVRPGVGSVSLGRDGVSQSVSYTNQQQYGAYTGAITAFKEWIEDEIVAIRGRYRGINMAVV